MLHWFEIYTYKSNIFDAISCLLSLFDASSTNMYKSVVEIYFPVWVYGNITYYECIGRIAVFVEC